MFLLNYPITRPIILGCRGLTITSVFAILFITLVTIINIISVGYELVPVISTDYNGTYTLWYEYILPKVWIPPSKLCDRALLTLNERFITLYTSLPKLSQLTGHLSTFWHHIMTRMGIRSRD